MPFDVRRRPHSIYLTKSRDCVKYIFFLLLHRCESLIWLSSESHVCVDMLVNSTSMCFLYAVCNVLRNEIYLRLKIIFSIKSLKKCSSLSLSRPRLSRITAYLEMKIWYLPKDETLRASNKILWKRGAISLFHNIFNISRISRVQLHIHLLNVVVRFIFSSILQFWYVEVRISRSISESPLAFEITRVDCK